MANGLCQRLRVPGTDSERLVLGDIVVIKPQKRQLGAVHHHVDGFLETRGDSALEWAQYTAGALTLFPLTQCAEQG